MADTIEKKKICFFSEGCTVAGELYLMGAAGGGRLPGIVLCHGFAGIKEILLPAFAERFAEGGFAVLTFDYRGFGESEGERGRLVPYEQMMDIRNAVTFLQTIEEVDSEKIGLWGTSFGGANAMGVAAVDQRIGALSVQLTFASGERMVKGDLDQGKLEKLESTLKSVRERTVTKNKSLKVNPNQLLTDDDSKAFYGKMVERYPQSHVKLPFSTLQHIVEFNPEDFIERVKCPVLIIAADRDVVCPPGESRLLHDKTKAPKRFVMLENCRHFDAYEGQPFEKGSEAALQWFKRHLGLQ
jgi:pimeloyl-ACP methyl ester carboxylesterase